MGFFIRVLNQNLPVAVTVGVLLVAEGGVEAELCVLQSSSGLHPTPSQ